MPVGSRLLRNLLIDPAVHYSVTPEEIRYVRPQVAPNELGQGGSTARQVLTKFCTSYWYVGPNMLEEWMEE